MEETHPFFSVIILCWNNNQTIRRCLEALSLQTYRSFEIVLVDNGFGEPISNDLVSVFPQLVIQLYRLEQNIGFAAGNNYAAAMAGGEYLALLNADAFPAPNWLEAIYKAINRYPSCFFTSKQIMANHPDRLDGAGDIYHVSGLAWRRAYNAPISALKDVECEVFSACAAAAIFPASAYRQVNGLDESYVSYAEDTDLSFRLRLLGYKCIYLPGAVVYHIGSASTERRSDLSVYYGHRNLVWTFIKDMPGAWVWFLAPIHLVVNLLMILVGISRRQGKVMLKAKMDALRNISNIWRKRSQVQASRTVASFQVMSVMDWNPLSPLIKLFNNNDLK